MVVLFAILLVDCEGWFCTLLGSLTGSRHAIVCILFSLEESRVVDLSGCWGPAVFIERIQCFGFWSLSALVAT